MGDCNMTFINEKYIKKYLIIIIVIFFSVSLITVLSWGNSTLLGSLETFDNDDVNYIRSAWTLVEKGVITYENTMEPTVFIMPGLTYVLALFTLVFGKIQGIVAFRIFQVGLQSLSIYILFLVAKKVFNSKVALITCFLDALYIVETYVTSLVLMETMFKFLFLLLIYLSIVAVEKNTMKYYVEAGIVWALGSMLRPTIAVYPLIIIIAWIKNKYHIKDMIKYTSVVFLIFCIVMGPWWIRNYREFNEFIPFTKSSGKPFLQGTFLNYDESGGMGVPYEEGVGLIDSNEKNFHMGIERLKTYGKKEPIKYFLWYTVGKTFYFWNDSFYWNDEIGMVVSMVEHYIILITGVIGIISLRGNKNTNVTMILLTILLMNLVYLPYFTFCRYSYPLMPLMMIFSAKAIGDFVKKKISMNSNVEKPLKILRKL